MKRNETSKMEIRFLEEKDLEEVSKLEAACFSEPWSLEDFRDILTNKDRIMLVAIEDNKIVGEIVLTDLLGEGDISNVAVNPDYRKKHIASKLLEKIIKIGSDERNITAFTLEVREQNLPAIKLYEKAGFESVGVRPNFYTKPKDNAVIMWKR